MKAISTLTCLLLLTGTIYADVWKVRKQPAVWVVSNSSESPNSSPTAQPAPVVKPSLTTGSDDALDEVNAYRVKKGLPPFQHDPQLTQAAKLAAETRAKYLWAGHLQSDFACLPSGASADAAGCGALEDSWGWATCCQDDNYSHAGAAWVRGSDGRRFMHLFVRNETAPVTNTATSNDCASGSCSQITTTNQLRTRRRR